MYRPRGYLDDPKYSSDDFRKTVAMATKEIMYHKNSGVPFITVSSLPEPEPKDVHFYHYYGQNGTPRNGPPPPSQSQDNSHPQSYVIVGNIEYGRLTSIDPARSTPGVSGVPSRVLAELQSVYAQVPHAVVIVMNHGGKITIQAQLVSQNGQDPNQTYSNNHNLAAPYQSPYQPPPPNYYQQPPPPPPQQPQIINVGPGVSTIRAQAPGQPIIVYSPRPIRRKPSPDEETIVVDINDFTDSEEESPRVGRRGPERRRRRMRAVNDGRSQLARKHEELYQVGGDDDDGVWRRSRYYTDRELTEREDRDRGRDRRDRRDRDHEREEPEKERKGVYRTGNSDDRKKNAGQDRTHGGLAHSQRRK